MPEPFDLSNAIEQQVEAPMRAVRNQEIGGGFGLAGAGAAYLLVRYGLTIPPPEKLVEVLPAALGLAHAANAMADRSGRRGNSLSDRARLAALYLDRLGSRYRAEGLFIGVMSAVGEAVSIHSGSSGQTLGALGIGFGVGLINRGHSVKETSQKVREMWNITARIAGQPSEVVPAPISRGRVRSFLGL